MPKFFMLGIALFLLLGAAGYGIATIQARSIPWDCADWQAFGHDDRTTAILESLAENRGKTLYCGVDQSDTFAKAETWEAGKDRNERDDTVYFGERGQFRGFIAAQEGYLTDGESGVTGVSIDRIFEFPREERRRTKRTKRLHIQSTDTCPDKHPLDSGAYTPGTLACSAWGSFHGAADGSPNTGKRRSRYYLVRDIRQDTETRGDTAEWTVAWDAFPSAAYWQEIAETQAKAACRAQGYPSVSNVVFGQGHNNDPGSNALPVNDRFRGNYLGWFFYNRQPSPNHRISARQSRSWTATCKKVVRRTRK